MKLELKTHNESYSKSIKDVLKAFLGIACLVIFCDVAIKLGIISRNYQIEYNCQLLSLEKSKSNFRKLSRLSKLKGKPRIWELCRQFVK